MLLAEIDWTHIILALIVGAPPTIAAVGAVVLGWRNSRKIDDNTTITVAGTSAAATNAEVAAVNASAAASKVDAIAVKLNGDLDERIRSVVREYTEPLHILFQVHAEQDDKHMQEIRVALGELRDKAVVK